jgi:hypothetical protein
MSFEVLKLDEVKKEGKKNQCKKSFLFKEVTNLFSKNSRKRQTNWSKV